VEGARGIHTWCGRAAHLALALAASAVLAGQQPADEPLAPKDPYTEGDPAAMKAAGIVGYGPFPWADGVTTAEVDKVLGAGRMLWVETAHFRIGSNFKQVAVPVEADEKKSLLAEVKDLRAKLPKVKDKPRTLDPWLRVHIYAQRAEALYAEYMAMLGVTDADFGAGSGPRSGKYLGLPDKFLILLFDKQSDLARYMDRFCGVKADKSFRHYHAKSSQMLAAFAREGFEDANELALQSHFVYSLVMNFTNGLMGYYYEVPCWLAEGIAHGYARRVPTKFVNIAIEDEAVDASRQHLWPQRVRARVGNDYFPKAAELLPICDAKNFKFADHLMAWSRVEFLRKQDDKAFGQFVRDLKSLDLPSDGSKVAPERIQARQAELLVRYFGLDAESFDAKWKDYVLKTYPKK
jgi:hypothetical protein